MTPGSEQGLLQSVPLWRLLFSLEYWKQVIFVNWNIHQPVFEKQNEEHIQHIQAFLAVARTGNFTKRP